MRHSVHLGVELYVYLLFFSLVPPSFQVISPSYTDSLLCSGHFGYVLLPLFLCLSVPWDACHLVFYCGEETPWLRQLIKESNLTGAWVIVSEGQSVIITAGSMAARALSEAVSWDVSNRQREMLGLWKSHKVSIIQCVMAFWNLTRPYLLIFLI